MDIGPNYKPVFLGHMGFDTAKNHIGLFGCGG
jgi:hypothetical protein